MRSLACMPPARRCTHPMTPLPPQRSRGSIGYSEVINSSVVLGVQSCSRMKGEARGRNQGRWQRERYRRTPHPHAGWQAGLGRTSRSSNGTESGAQQAVPAHTGNRGEKERGGRPRGGSSHPLPRMGHSLSLKLPRMPAALLRAAPLLPAEAGPSAAQPAGKQSGQGGGMSAARRSRQQGMGARARWARHGAPSPRTPIQATPACCGPPPLRTTTQRTWCASTSMSTTLAVSGCARLDGEAGRGCSVGAACMGGRQAGGCLQGYTGRRRGGPPAPLQPGSLRSPPALPPGPHLGRAAHGVQARPLLLGVVPQDRDALLHRPRLHGWLSRVPAAAGG